MKQFQQWRTIWAALAVFALMSNIAVCTLRCAAAGQDSGGYAGGVLGPLAFCSHDGAGGNGTDGAPAGHSQHHCVVCHAATALARTMVAVFVSYPADRQDTVALHPWDDPPPLARHILSGALRSRAPPLSLLHTA